MKFKELREKYRSKYPSALVSAAVKIALDMGGNMTGAYKKIEKMKRGLGDDPIVKDALRMANEEATIQVDEKLRAGKGKGKADIDYIGDSDLTKKIEKKYKLKIKQTGNTTADLIGNKQNIVNFLMKHYYYDADEVEELYPDLLEGVLAELNFSYAFFDKSDLQKFLSKVKNVKGLEVVSNEKQPGGHFVVRVKSDNKKVIAKSNSIALQAMS